MSQIIKPTDLMAFDDLVGQYPITVDLVYAQPDHVDNIFKTALYKPNAKCWGHRDMVNLTVRAAEYCFKETGFSFEIKDCLRPTEAQARMMETEIVQKNPHWIEPPNRLLSPSGKGGHPRGMAVDIVVRDDKNHEIDMGTRFDYLTEDRTQNPAARNYMDFPKHVLENRKNLERWMLQAADDMGVDLLPLPSEWWDFRFMPDYSNKFDPICDRNLPADMQMMFHDENDTA